MIFVHSNYSPLTGRACAAWSLSVHGEMRGGCTSRLSITDRDPMLPAESPLTNGGITKIIHRKTLDKHIRKMHDEEASSLGHPHIPIIRTSCPMPKGF